MSGHWSWHYFIFSLLVHIIDRSREIKYFSIVRENIDPPSIRARYAKGSEADFRCTLLLYLFLISCLCALIFEYVTPVRLIWCVSFLLLPEELSGQCNPLVRKDWNWNEGQARGPPPSIGGWVAQGCIHASGTFSLWLEWLSSA